MLGIGCCLQGSHSSSGLTWVSVLPRAVDMRTELQAKIDSLLLGAESSFFLHRRGAGMRYLTHQGV